MPVQLHPIQTRMIAPPIRLDPQHHLVNAKRGVIDKRVERKMLRRVSASVVLPFSKPEIGGAKEAVVGVCGLHFRGICLIEGLHDCV